MAKDSRENILETAFLLFMQKSFKAVTMNEIVKQSGLSKGAFYHYFESKEKVFEEVIRHYYSDLFYQDFNSFSHNSLKEFLKDYSDDVKKKFLSVKKIGNLKQVNQINHYLLIFDALRILPNFRAEHKEKDKEEIKSWKNIIRIARKKGEIKSALTDEKIARIFMYMGDGFGMHVIFDSDIENLPQRRKELEKLWDDFYALLKT